MKELLLMYLKSTRIFHQLSLLKNLYMTKFFYHNKLESVKHQCNTDGITVSSETQTIGKERMVIFYQKRYNVGVLTIFQGKRKSKNSL